MCDKCEQLDKKIGHYQKLLLGIADQLTVDRIKCIPSLKAALSGEV
jgi:hypothetical protein